MKKALYCNDCETCGMIGVKNTKSITCNKKNQSSIIKLKRKDYIVMIVKSVI